MDFTATWYCPSGGVGDGLTTATGTHVSSTTLAVDPSLIPLGSVVEMDFPDGHTEIRTAEDTGGAIHGSIVDVFTWDERTAINNGRQHIRLRIVGHKNLGR